jgi:hypothetical protein
MILRSTYTTKRLEGYARSLGMTYGVAYVEENAGGRYFVVNDNGKALTHWLGLGWTADQARDELQQIAEAIEREKKQDAANGYDGSLL